MERNITAHLTIGLLATCKAGTLKEPSLCPLTIPLPSVMAP